MSPARPQRSVRRRAAAPLAMLLGVVLIVAPAVGGSPATQAQGPAPTTVVDYPTSTAEPTAPPRTEPPTAPATEPPTAPATEEPATTTQPAKPKPTTPASGERSQPKPRTPAKPATTVKPTTPSSAAPAAAPGATFDVPERVSRSAALKGFRAHFHGLKAGSSVKLVARFKGKVWKRGKATADAAGNARIIVKLTRKQRKKLGRKTLSLHFAAIGSNAHPIVFKSKLKVG